MKLGFSSIAASANFTVDSGTTTCSTSLALAPGASCNVGVASTPKVAGNLGGTLALNDNALNANATQTVGLAGSGTGLTISPSNVNFGTVNLFTLNETTVTVTNNGSSTVTINGASVAPGTAPAWAFPVISWCWGPLAPGKSCQIWVFYFADAVGTRTATLDITDSAPGSPQQVGLTANVINPIAQLNPFSVNFGYQNVGSQTTWPVKLTNVGQTNLNISGYGFVGDNPHDFSESNNCPSSLSPSASCTINVTFAPAARGYRDAVLVINDNVAGGQTWLWVQGGGH
ncbi:MAG: choice-of-anchor D domain-containing protein, partial [Terriglobales bacterium]